MNIIPVGSYLNSLKSKLNFSAYVAVTSNAKEQVKKEGTSRLFDLALDIFQRKISKVESYDNILIDKIPDRWKGFERYNRLRALGKETLMMKLNGYHECGFYVNPYRSVGQVADDLWNTYSNLEAR